MIRLRRKLKKTFKNVILHKLYLNPLNLVWELFVFSFLPLSNELREVVRRNKAWKGWIFAENFHLWCRELCGCKTEMGTVDGGLVNWTCLGHLKCWGVQFDCSMIQILRLSQVVVLRGDIRKQEGSNIMKGFSRLCGVCRVCGTNEYKCNNPIEAFLVSSLRELVLSLTLNFSIYIPWILITGNRILSFPITPTYSLQYWEPQKE